MPISNIRSQVLPLPGNETRALGSALLSSSKVTSNLVQFVSSPHRLSHLRVRFRSVDGWISICSNGSIPLTVSGALIVSWIVFTGTGTVGSLSSLCSTSSTTFDTIWFCRTVFSFHRYNEVHPNIPMTMKLTTWIYFLCTLNPVQCRSFILRPPMERQCSLPPVMSKVKKGPIPFSSLAKHLATRITCSPEKNLFWGICCLSGCLVASDAFLYLTLHTTPVAFCVEGGGATDELIYFQTLSIC